MDKQDTVYLARAVPLCNIYEVVELCVRTVYDDDTYVGYDTNTKQAFLFSGKDIGVQIFTCRKDAADTVNAIKECHGLVKLTKVVGDDD